ncbi:MAG: hypothetical protein WAS33_14840, partial [Candidatus Promineifilaceae bacterium]
MKNKGRFLCDLPKQVGSANPLPPAGLFASRLLISKLTRLKAFSQIAICLGSIHMCHLDSNDKPLLASEAAEKGLRQRAEDLTQEIASPSLFEIATSSPEEFAKVLYELQVHQIELELQNEELRQTQLNLEESRRRYFELYDLAPVGYLTLNLAGIIEEANLTAAEMLGV